MEFRKTLIKTCMPKPIQMEIVQSSLIPCKGMSSPGTYRVREMGGIAGLPQKDCTQTVFCFFSLNLWSLAISSTT